MKKVFCLVLFIFTIVAWTTKKVHALAAPDTNWDGIVNNEDIKYTLQSQGNGPCIDTTKDCDIKNDGKVNILDVAYIPMASIAKNVIVILVDDLDEGIFNTLLSKGKLPNIQTKLVNAGFRFSNSYVTDSICCPSRATLLTGKYSHNTKVRNVVGTEASYPAFKNNGNESSNLAVWLGNNNFYTGHIGKFLNSAPTTAPPGWDFWRLLAGYDTRPGHYIAYENSVTGISPNFYGAKYLAEQTKAFIDTFAGRPEKSFFLQVAPHGVHADIPGWQKNTDFPLGSGELVAFDVYDHPNAIYGRIQTLIRKNSASYEIWQKGSATGWTWQLHPASSSFFTGTDTSPVVSFNILVHTDGVIKYQVIRGTSQTDYQNYSCDFGSTLNPLTDTCNVWTTAATDGWKLQSGDTNPIVAWSSYVQPNNVIRQEIVRGTQSQGYDLYYRLSTDWNTWIKVARGWDFNFAEPSDAPIVAWNSFLETQDKMRHHLLRGSGTDTSGFAFFYKDENSFWGNDWPPVAYSEIQTALNPISSNVLASTTEESMQFPLGILNEDEPLTGPQLVTNPTVPGFVFGLRSYADGNWENHQAGQSFTYPNGYPAGSLRQNGDTNSFFAVNADFDLPTNKPSFNNAVCDANGKPEWICANWLDLESVQNDGLTLKDYARRFQLDRMETLTGLDAMVGEMYDKLVSTNLIASTTIIFTSDNGYLMGEFRLGDKSAGYEEAVRVPLIIKTPTSGPNTNTQLVANIDLAPTILEQAGLNWTNPLYTVDGRSLVPFFTNPLTSWRDVLLMEHHYPRGVSLDRPHQLIPDYTAIHAARLSSTTNPYLYVVYGEDPTTIDGDDTGFEELYNVQTDPYQITNQVNNASLGAIKTELERFRTDLSGCAGSTCRTFDVIH